MKHYFVINPAAGRGKTHPKLQEAICDYCTENGIEYAIYITAAEGDAEAFVRRTAAAAETPCRFYACGGDGTLCEVVNGAAGLSGVEVGVIPIGTGNDFVRNFTSSELFSQVGAQIRGVAQRVDLIRYNDRYFINMLNTGFDCEVVRRTNQIKASPLIPAGMAYIIGVIIELIEKPGVTMTVSIDGGEAVERQLLLACIGNGAFYGGGFHCEPRASLVDGMLEVSLIKDLSRARFISIVGDYKSGKYLDREDLADLFEYVRCSRLDITFPAPHTVSVDGELEDVEKLSISVEREGILFSIPEGSRLESGAAEEIHA